MTDTLVRAHINADLVPDASGVLQWAAGNIERWYSPGAPKPDYPLRDVIVSADLAGMLPAQGALILQVQALTDQLAAVTADRDTKVAEVAALQAQIDAANNPAESVTNYQARAALLAAGLFDQVDAAVKAQGVDSQAFQAWEYANNIYRSSALINGLATALGLSAGQVDDLFAAAAKIDA